MKARFGQLRKRYTFLVIPDTDDRTRRFQLSALSMIAAGAAVLLLVVSALFLLMLRTNDAARIHSLYQELTASTDSFASSIDERERAIESLQGEMMRLTEEAGALKQRLAELGELETELQAIVGTTLPGVQSTIPREVRALSAGTEPGMGGEDHPFPDGHMILATEQPESFTSMKYEASALQNRLRSMVSAVQQKLELLRVTPTFWPTENPRITSEFGMRRDPFTRRKAMHSGLDLGGRTGDPILAAADGTVADSAYNSSRGHYVVITHPSGLQTCYMHLRKRLVEAGQQVQQGEQIGLLGSTGRSTGPHLHFEVWKNGQPVDPADYLMAY